MEKRVFSVCIISFTALLLGQGYTSEVISYSLESLSIRFSRSSNPIDYFLISCIPWCAFKLEKEKAIGVWRRSVILLLWVMAAFITYLLYLVTFCRIESMLIPSDLIVISEPFSAFSTLLIGVVIGIYYLVSSNKSLLGERK